MFYIGVRLPHRVIYNRLNWQWNRFPYSNTEETCVFKTSLTFVDSIAEIWAPLLHDTPRRLMIISKVITKDPERLINALHENKVKFAKIEICVLVQTRKRTGKQNYKNKNLFVLNQLCIGIPLYSNSKRLNFEKPN